MTNAKFVLNLSYGIMHHCTKFGEYRSRNFCVIASQTPKMHIFLINKKGGKFFGDMTEALAPPPPPKKTMKKKLGKNMGRRIQYRLSSDLSHVFAHLHVASSDGLIELCDCTIMPSSHFIRASCVSWPISPVGYSQIWWRRTWIHIDIK